MALRSYPNIRAALRVMRSVQFVREGHLGCLEQRLPTQLLGTESGQLLTSGRCQLAALRDASLRSIGTIDAMCQARVAIGH